MKKSLLMKTMLLLLALVTGSTCAWAATYTMSMDSGTKNGTKNVHWTANNATLTYSDVSWSASFSGGSITNSNNYVQIGSKNSPFTSITLSTSDIVGTITEVIVGCGAYQSNATVAVTVGGNAFGGDAQSVGSAPSTSGPCDQNTFTGSASGEIVVTITNGNNGRAGYIDYVAVTYSSSDPSSNATFANATPSINYPATKTYSQAPTTAAGYTGTISYSMTANTAGATINAESGLVTVTKAGEVTVKATAAAVPGSFAASEASYTLTVNDTRTSAGLAWSAASANVTYGADNVFPTLTNPHSVAVTYSSSNTSAATINKSGEITLKDVTSSTTISAIFAGNDDYKEQTVTYELNVTKAPFVKKDGVFDFVGAATADPFEDYGSGVTLTSDEYTKGENTWTAGNVTMVTSDGGGSGIRWWSADGTLRFYNKATATFSVPSGYVITKIVTTGANFSSANVGTLSGSTWKGASAEVELSVTATKNIEKITVTYMTPTQTETVQSYGWASYVTPAAVEFPENTAYVVTAASVSTGLTLAAVTQVPEKTPVLLKGAGAKEISVIASATAPATNLLKVSNGYVADGKYAYVLAKNGTGACFKQWTGDASVLEGRVILLLDQAVSAREIFELDDETTGVNEVRGKMADGRSEYFNLAGQRVTNPTKGLYIVNGKKVIIK